MVIHIYFNRLKNYINNTLCYKKLEILYEESLYLLIAKPNDVYVDNATAILLANNVISHTQI